MQKQKLLTIATINLNNSEGLRRTIQSFQPLRKNKEIEFIFQDGGSKDHSLGVAQIFYRHDEIVSERDRGVYDAMNRTTLRATGEHILWINSGDEIISDAWKEIKQVLTSKKPDLAVFSTKMIDTGKSVNWMGPNDEDIAKGVPHPSTIFKTEKIKENGGYDTSFRIAGDYDLILRLARQGATINASSTPIAIFYLGGISSDGESWLETWRALNKNKILPFWKLALNNLKYHVTTRFRMADKIQLKRLSVVSPEKRISLYDIGGVRTL